MVLTPIAIILYKSISCLLKSIWNNFPFKVQVGYSFKEINIGYLEHLGVKGEECLACKLYLSQSFLLPGLELSGPPVFPLDTTVVATKANKEYFVSDARLRTIFKDQQQERK